MDARGGVRLDSSIDAFISLNISFTMSRDDFCQGPRQLADHLRIASDFTNCMNTHDATWWLGNK